MRILALIVAFAGCIVDVDLEDDQTIGEWNVESTPAPSPTPTPTPPDDPGDNDACRGECGRRCEGIGGNHYCTPECRKHDDCYRGCLESGCITCVPLACMTACTLEWYDAYVSFLQCWWGLRDCDCPW